MAPQADPQSGTCSNIDPLSVMFSSDTYLLGKCLMLTKVFRDNIFRLDMLDLYLEHYIAFCDGFNIIIKI